MKEHACSFPNKHSPETGKMLWVKLFGEFQCFLIREQRKTVREIFANVSLQQLLNKHSVRSQTLGWGGGGLFPSRLFTS